MSKSVENKGSSFAISLCVMVVIAVFAMVAMVKSSLSDIHDRQESRVVALDGKSKVDETLKAMGKGWLLQPETVASTHVRCVSEGDLAKAQKDVDSYNSSFNAKVFGTDTVTNCVLKDNATHDEIKAEVAKVMNLDGSYVIGSVQNFNQGGFTKDSYTIKSVHVMTPKS